MSIVAKSIKGEKCPRCGEFMEVRKHERITQVQLSKPFFYEYWFNCNNPRCKTTLVMPENAKVYPDGRKAMVGQNSQGPLTTKRKNIAKVPKHYCVVDDCNIPPWEICPHSDRCNPYATKTFQARRDR